MKLNVSKKTLVAAFAIASVAGASLFSTAAYAHSDPTATDSLASKIASKFDLDQNEVKSALEEFYEEQRAEFEAKFNAQLDQAVINGELTEEQKALVMAKRDEIKPRLDEIRAMQDETQRHEAMKALHDELKAWAKEHDIALRWLGGSGIKANEPRAHDDLVQN